MMQKDQRPALKRRKTNEEVIRDRIHAAVGLDLVEDVADVTLNVVDSVFSVFD